jgi:3-methyladenine DNA glycosylase AlkD
MAVQDLYHKITKELEKEAIKKFNSKEEYFNWDKIHNENRIYKAYGLSVPEIRKIVKKFTKEFNDLSFKQKIDLSKRFYKSNYIAQTIFGLKLLGLSITSINPQNFNILEEIVSSLKDWGPTDSFSLDIVQPLLRKYPNETKVLLKKWNESDHIWTKRVSIVTFTRKIGSEGAHVDFLLELCNHLISDNEDLVRKAIGWALKDNMIGKNKEKVLSYVKNLRKMGVSSTITLYAIRNLKGNEREEVLKIKPTK